MPSGDSKQKLRLITYLSPGAISLGLLDLLRDYLEEELGTEAYIIYESRWSGPPAGRADPFTTDDVDMAFMCSTAYLRLVQDKNKHIELCYAAPIYDHPMASGRPVYFSEVVVHTENVKKYKDFHALKGCRWAYNEDISLSGNVMVLAELKKLGFNASFFGHILQSGSHMNSLQMILDYKVDAAAIDSNTLATYRKEFPERAEQITKIASFGPMPIQPIVFNKHLPDARKKQITEALLSMHTKPKWGDQLHHFGITQYTTVDESLYDMETGIKDLVRDQSITPAYY